MHPRQPKSPHIPQPSRPPGTAVERSTRSGVTHRQLQTKARRGHGTCSTLPCTTVPMALEQRRGARPLKSPALPSTFTICLAGGETGGVRAPPCAHRAWTGCAAALTVGEEAWELVDLAAEDVPAQGGRQRFVPHLRRESTDGPHGPPPRARSPCHPPKSPVPLRCATAEPRRPRHALTCTSTFTYMRGCESTVSPEPRSTCEASSAMLPPRRHGSKDTSTASASGSPRLPARSQPTSGLVAMATRPAQPSWPEVRRRGLRARAVAMATGPEVTPWQLALGSPSPPTGHGAAQTGHSHDKAAFNGECRRSSAAL